MGADQSLDIHPEYASGYDYAGLAAVGNARTPSFVLFGSRKRTLSTSGDLNRWGRDCVKLATR